MTKTLVRCSSAFAAGALFGIGLVLGGMTQPSKVLGFLDVFGAWDPSLLFVMLGAISVHAISYRVVRGWARPLAAEVFKIPAGRAVDKKLLLGAATFGVGWGLGGYCPGPSVVSLASGFASVLVFFGGLLLGSFLTLKWERAALKDPSHRVKTEDMA